MRKSILLLSLLLLLPGPRVLGQAAPPPQATAQGALNDGPYVLWEGQEAKVLRVRDGKLEEERLRKPWRLALPGLPILALNPATPAPAPCSLPMPPKVAAISDIHGHCQQARTLLTAHGIMDAQGRWTFGKGHLVVIGDTCDRGDQATEAYWMLRSLESQAAAAGGRVHVLLGNHDLMDLRGDLRYLNPKYAALAGKVLPRSLPDLYAPDTELGRWLRGRNVMIRLGDFLFTHGGLSPALARDLAAAAPGPVDLEALNAAFRAAQGSPRGQRLLANDGPVWYRGLIPGATRTDATDPEIDTALAAFGARRIVVGHTTLDRITVFHGGRVHDVDAGLHEGRPGELWLFDGKSFHRGLCDGTRLPLD